MQGHVSFGIDHHFRQISAIRFILVHTGRSDQSVTLYFEPHLSRRSKNALVGIYDAVK